nr:RES family NAD+ phosphorylase [Massilia antarctica]
MYRISGHNTGEPFFGRTAGCRFDDPAKRFGTCDLGMDLQVAFAESVLHNLEPVGGRFLVPEPEISRRFALHFEGPELKLANLTGSSLLLSGGNGELTGTSDHSLPQQWAKAVEAHPERVDGLIYISRRVSGSLAVVLFERDRAKPISMTMASAVPLHEHIDFAKTLCAFNIDIV